MIKIHLPKSNDFFDEASGEFVDLPEINVKLENSLVAISRWESKFHKSFFTTTAKNEAELLYFIRCMSLTDELLDEITALRIISSQPILKEIKKYLDDPMTATVVKKQPGGKKSSETTTSELVYYWLVAHQIPFSCEWWNINRLIKLVEVCNAKNQPGKKMSKNDSMRQHKSLNAARRAKRR